MDKGSSSHLFFCGIDTPISKPEDIIPFLGRGPLHWREGRSAYETAYSWFGSKDIPATIRNIFQTDPIFSGAKLRRAFFERQTQFDDIHRGPSQTDLLAHLQTLHGPAVMAIEAKVDEPFGPLVKEWSDGSLSKKRRLEGLLRRLSINASEAAGLRYQLLHRTVASLVEAKQFSAQHAALVIQSFSAVHACFDDFRLFANAIGAAVERPGALSKPVLFDGVSLRLGWATCPLRAATP